METHQKANTGEHHPLEPNSSVIIYANGILLTLKGVPGHKSFVLNREIESCHTKEFSVLK